MNAVPGGRPAKGYSSAQFKFPDQILAGSVAAVVLAGGRGSRFGDDTPKPLARLGNRPLIGHAVAAATLSGLRPVVVVVGYRGDEVAAAAGSLAQVIVNPHWEEGMSTSLRAALVALQGERGVSAVAVSLADQPRIGAEAYRRLAGASRQGADLAVATYGGKRGHPVLIGRRHWAEAMRMQGDEGARSLLARHPVVEVECDGTGTPVDIDTLEDLAALEG
jgi:CTP:molybdopterin cytidylyltransferase MocA